jgi:hypothetical protein
MPRYLISFDDGSMDGKARAELYNRRTSQAIVSELDFVNVEIARGIRSTIIVPESELQVVRRLSCTSLSHQRVEARRT